MKQFCVAASKSARNLTLRARNASVLAAHHPAAYVKPTPMPMDPLQYILHSTDASLPPLPAPNARKLAMTIAAQRQRMEYACSNAETTRILSVQPQPHGHTIEVEMSTSDLQRMLQRVSATRHSQQSCYKHAENAAAAEAESASQNGKRAGGKWPPPAMLLLSAVLGTGGVLLEMASSLPQVTATAFISDPAFMCNALFCL